jgi:hypothetical protein
MNCTGYGTADDDLLHTRSPYIPTLSLDFTSV